jgi:hypothetical protein
MGDISQSLLDAAVTTFVEFVGEARIIILAHPEIQDWYMIKNELLKIELVFQNSHPKLAMEYATEYVLPHQAAIKNKELSFFDEEKYNIFQGIKKKYIDDLADLIKTRITDHNRNTIWKYLETLCEIADMYNKVK